MTLLFDKQNWSLYVSYAGKNSVTIDDFWLIGGGDYAYLRRLYDANYAFILLPGPPGKKSIDSLPKINIGPQEVWVYEDEWIY